MYQDTSEFASKSHDKQTLECGTGSIESFRQHFGGAVGLGHNHATSAEETVLSPGGTLLSNHEGSSKQTTENQLSYEQLVKEHEAVKRAEPTLVTTLRPYNY